MGIQLQLTELNRGNYDDMQGIYPLSSLPQTELCSFNKYAMKFASIPDEYKTKSLSSVYIHMYAYPASGSGGTYPTQLYYTARHKPYDASVINYNNILINRTYTGKDAYSYTFNYSQFTWQYAKFYPSAMVHALKYGIEFIPDEAYTGDRGVKFITSGANAPYLEVNFASFDIHLEISSASPTSGYHAKSLPCVFNWSVSPNGTAYEPPTLTNSKLRYRANSSAEYTEIDCGTAKTYTLPADTITTDSFQWQVVITDSLDHQDLSPWYTISTLEELSTASCVSPSNTIIDGTVANEFIWNHIISTGTAQTKADLQYSNNAGSTWSTLATVTGAIQKTSIVANFFNSGEYMWRVRTYNTDSNAGAWSEAVAFTVMSAPSVPTVTSEQNPRPLVSWQSADQQGFEVYIDGVFDSGIVFGESKSYRLPIYLDDGTYTVKVKIQNSYGIWSESGSAPINVTNIEGASMVLTSYVDNNVRLDWTEQLSYAYYLVYRDGICIAKIRSNSFVDKTAIGTHEYFIRGIYASSQNYGKSNTISATIAVSNTVISDLQGETTLVMTTTDSSYSEIIIEEAITYQQFRIASADYPYIEKSRHKDKSISLKVAYKTDNEDRFVFESLIGKEVCVKTPRGSSVIGTLLGLSKRETCFMVAFECSLMQSAYDEEVSL